MKKSVVWYHRNLNKYIILVLTPIMLLSCATVHHIRNLTGDASLILSGETRQKISRLRRDLAALDHNIDESEAGKLAETSIDYSLFLADEYRLVRPPFLHNILVRLGIKNRGLCYHWTEDLMERLNSLELKSFSLHTGVAYRGSDLREHNSVVVTARGQRFAEGIVLDPWRNSGNLYWIHVSADRYPWEER